MSHSLCAVTHPVLCIDTLTQRNLQVPNKRNHALLG